MTYQFLSQTPPDTYPSMIDSAEPILINPSNKHFLLLNEPHLAEIADLINEHAEVRREAAWNDYMKVARKGKHISLLSIRGYQLTHVSQELILRHFGCSALFQLAEIRSSLSIDEQRRLTMAIKPKNTVEMLALYNGTAEDETGYHFFNSRLRDSATAVDFFGNLIDDLFKEILLSYNSRSGLPNPHRTRSRTLELLCLAAKRGWLLFPFLNFNPKENLIAILTSGWNFDSYFVEGYRPTEAGAILSELNGLRSKTIAERNKKNVAFFMLCSTFRNFDQLSTPVLDFVFNTCVNNSKSPSKKSQQAWGSKNPPSTLRQSLNALVRIRNSKFKEYSPVKLLSVEKKLVTIEDFVSFTDFREAHPRFSSWTYQFEKWISSAFDTQHGVRRTFCNDFLDFLVHLPEAPCTALEIKRHHINDTSTNGNTFRNYIERKHVSKVTRNLRLSMASQFFEFLADTIERSQTSQWLRNPVDMRFDRFSDQRRTFGSVRKAIGSHIMQVMRDILVENDYAWAKERTSWGYAADKITGRLEHVWCPSSALLLYTLLSVPIRGVQARMLDSGEGDSLIYDFTLQRMVPNAKQLYVDERLSPTRREGLLQVLPSGMVGGGDIVGMWIPVNKTSDKGYFIPWVSEDLLKQLKYQRDWLDRYSDMPNMQTISDAQGRRSEPTTFVNTEAKFFCLFRDIFVEHMPDHSIPVAKQKTAKLWGQLCLEAQNRINNNSTGNSNILLVKPGSENTTYPKAIHDIHSLRVSGITDLLDRGVPLNIVSEYVAGHATYIMTLWYDKPSAGAIRRHLQEAHDRAGSQSTAIPDFTQEQIQEHKEHLVSHHLFQDSYNGFDALDENMGLATVRLSGICPGTRCNEGALDDRQRAIPVPAGDRGPSCPQCRFWLTGPAFLLGQTIEGNQLIFKIREKTAALNDVRERIMDAEDIGNMSQAQVLRGQQDLEERQLNDMLTEWWHRMRFYEASRQKLEFYRKSMGGTDESNQIMDVASSGQLPPDWSVSQSSSLELTHFLSTCAELLPESSLDSKAAKQDIELAVAKFLAINNNTELAMMYFKLDDDERLTAANLTVDLLLQTSKDPEHASSILEGRESLASIPNLQRGMEYLFNKGLTNSVVEKNNKSEKELHHGIKFA